MSGVSGISSLAGGGMPLQLIQPVGLAETPAVAGQGNVAGASAAANESIVSISSTSMAASTESLAGTIGPVIADDKLLGAILLLLILEYMQSNDEEEKKGLLALMSLLATQQEQQQQGGTFMYNASSLSMESTQIQAISNDSALNSYTPTGGGVSQAPSAELGSAGLDVLA